MKKNEITKEYLKKIKLINKFNKFYFEKDKPIVSDEVYDDLNPMLKAAAIRNVLAHLIDLYERDKVSTDKFSQTAKFSQSNEN